MYVGTVIGIVRADGTSCESATAMCRSSPPLCRDAELIMRIGVALANALR